MLLTLFVDALGAYLVADGLIGSRSMRENFIKAGLFGKDLNNMFGVYMQGVVTYTSPVQGRT